MDYQTTKRRVAHKGGIFVESKLGAAAGMISAAAVNFQGPSPKLREGPLGIVSKLVDQRLGKSL
jgi:hypothetical protein